MSRSNVLFPTQSPDPVPIRPSDRLASQMPRHPLAAIPVRPRRDSFAIEPGDDPRLAEAAERLQRELEALDYSAELL